MRLTRRLLSGVAAPIAALVAVGGIVGPMGGGAASRAARAQVASTAVRPNIVLVVTDDQRADELEVMRSVRGLLVDRGMRLERAFVVNPLCCPSRTTILTGLHSHGTGIYMNGSRGAHGGFDDFDDRRTLPIWLRRAGYRTGLFGKYLNGYDRAAYVPPGWSTWRALVGTSMYLDYELSVDGRSVMRGSTPDDHSVDVLAGMADDFVRSTPSEQPLFMYLAPPAPHGPFLAPPRYQDTPIAPVGPLPSFDEARVRDKPAWIQRLPRLTKAERREMSRRWVAKARTLLAVDDAVERVIHALEETGRMSNTLFVFTSDNGMSHGEHRLSTKLNPYEESVRVPMIVRWDGQIPPGTTSRSLVANVDLAPTFLAAAGIASPDRVEGVSLLPLLRRGEPVRTSVLIEHQHNPITDGKQDPPTYCAIRLPRWKLVRYGNAVELYDLERDPWELRNLARRDEMAQHVRRLTERLRTLCQPRPPGLPRF